MLSWVYLSEGLGRHSRAVATSFKGKVKVVGTEYLKLKPVLDRLVTNIKSAEYNLSFPRGGNVDSLQGILDYHRRALDYYELHVLPYTQQGDRIVDGDLLYRMLWGSCHGDATDPHATWATANVGCVDKLQINFCRFNQGTNCAVKDDEYYDRCRALVENSPHYSGSKRDKRVAAWAVAEASAYVRFLRISHSVIKPVTGRVHVVLTVNADSVEVLIPLICSVANACTDVRLRSAKLYPPVNLFNERGYEAALGSVFKTNKSGLGYFNSFNPAYGLMKKLSVVLKVLYSVIAVERNVAYQSRPLYEGGDLGEKFIHRETKGAPAQIGDGTVRLIFY